MAIRENIAQFKEQRRARRVERQRMEDAKASTRHDRRVAVGKAVACAVVLALLLAIAFLAGDSTYHATLVGWVPFLTVLFAIALAFAYLQLVKRRLTFSEEAFATSCQRDSDVRFSVRFGNPLPLLVYRLEAFLFMADAMGTRTGEMSTTLALAPYDSQAFGFTMRFDHIGVYEAGLDRVVVSDFLGLFKTTLRRDQHALVNVTPKMHSVRGVRFSNDAMMEASRAAQAVLADSMDYAYSREYVTGDPLKTIHWKLSARTGQYMTRLYEVYTNPGVCVVLDFYGPSDDTVTLMSMFDTVVEAGFSLAEFAHTSGFDTEVRYVARDGGARLLHRWGQGELASIVSEMPAMSGNAVDASDALDVIAEQIGARQGQNNLVVCSANLDASMLSLVAGAKSLGRAPLFVAIVPVGLEGRERDAYCKPLARLDAAGVPYMAISQARELSEVR